MEMDLGRIRLALAHLGRTSSALHGAAAVAGAAANVTAQHTICICRSAAMSSMLHMPLQALRWDMGRVSSAVSTKVLNLNRLSFLWFDCTLCSNSTRVNIIPARASNITGPVLTHSYCTPDKQ